MAIYACKPCQTSHSSCDNFRPCHNCVRKGIQDSCITVQHRRRGRPGKTEKEQTTPLFSHRPFPSPPKVTPPPSAASLGATGTSDSPLKRDLHQVHQLHPVQHAPVQPHNIRMVVTPDLQTTIEITQKDSFAHLPNGLPSLHDITSVFHTPRLANLQAKLALGDVLPVENINVVDRHGQYFASTLSIKWLEKGKSVLADLKISNQVTAVPTLPSALPPMMSYAATSLSRPASSSSSSDRHHARPAQPQRTRTSINALCDR